MRAAAAVWDPCLPLPVRSFVRMAVLSPAGAVCLIGLTRPGAFLTVIESSLKRRPARCPPAAHATPRGGIPSLPATTAAPRSCACKHGMASRKKPHNSPGSSGRPSEQGCPRLLGRTATIKGSVRAVQCRAVLGALPHGITPTRRRTRPPSSRPGHIGPPPPTHTHASCRRPGEPGLSGRASARPHSAGQPSGPPPSSTSPHAGWSNHAE